MKYLILIATLLSANCFANEAYKELCQDEAKYLTTYKSLMKDRKLLLETFRKKVAGIKCSNIKSKSCDHALLTKITIAYQTEDKRIDEAEKNLTLETGCYPELFPKEVLKI